MKIIAGYRITETLFQGTRSEIYRASKNEKSYIIKVPTTPYAESKLIHEFNVGQRTDSEYIIKFLEIATDTRYGHVLVEEDDKAQTLLRLIPAQGFPPLTFLRIAIQLAEGLQHIHENNVIHKDIKPANIIMLPQCEKIKFIDFNSALTQRNHQPAVVCKYTASTEATLAYISPELTGRINQRVDYRTDFYSLGVTFYQLLCGTLPFQTKSVAELVHSHLAKQPSAPHEVRPDIPKQLSAVVMMLMEKSAESRYQSACGLLADLKICLEELAHNGEISPFVLGQQDISEFFCIPVKLYGRDEEIAVLTQACERVSKASTEVMVIEGEAGSGKSILVQEMQPVMAAKGGYFLMGKYESLKCHVPYNAIIQALQSWVEQVIASTNEEIKSWKTLLLDQLGNQGQLMIDLLPELEIIIGKQPPVPLLDSEKSKMRCHFVVQNFVKALTTSAPILLFLDNLQWADAASLELLETLLTNPSIKHLLLVATYRTLEANTFTQLMDKMTQSGIPLNKIVVKPLSFDTINQMTADTVRRTLEETVPLTSVICQKTAGSPFFVRMFLQSIYDQELLSQVGGHWQWNLEKIKCLPVTENLISFLVQQIQELPQPVQELLQFISCVGLRFSFEKLRQIQDLSPGDLGNQLNTLVEKGLLLENNDEYIFAHDRVQEAVLQQIPPEKEMLLHLMIGRKLKDSNDVEAVDHLNRGIPFIKDEKELIELGKLNLTAGKKIKDRSFTSALGYLKTALQCVQSVDIWLKERDFAVQLHKELADLEHLTTNHESTKYHINILLEHSTDVVEKAEFYNLLTFYVYSKLQFREAVDIGLGALKLLGIEIDTTNTEVLCKEEWSQLRTTLARIDLNSLLTAPVATDPRAVTAMKIMETVIPITYVFNPVLNNYMVAKLMSLTLDHGNSKESTFAVSGCAAYLVAKFGDISGAYDLGQIAIKLSENTANLSNMCRSYFMYASAIHHWKKPLIEADPYFRKTEEVGEAAGDYQYLGYTLFWKAVTRFYLAIPLEDLEMELVGDLQRPWIKSHKTMTPQLQAVLLALADLRGTSPPETVFTDPKVTEKEYIARWKEQKQPSVVTYNSLKAQVLYLRGEFEAALVMITETENFLGMLLGVILVPCIHFFAALIRLALYPTATPEAQKEYLDKIEACETKLKTWAEHSPENYLHKFLLVQAEKGRVLSSESWAIADKYEQAVQASQKSGSLFHEALTNELAAKFFLNLEKPMCARGFLQASYQLYEQWGAKRKVEQLANNYASTLKSNTSKLSSFSITGEETISANSLRLLDLTTILKTSQLISSEVDLRKFLSKILKILITTAGAQRASFFIMEGGKLFSQAECTTDGQLTIMQHQPLSNWEHGSRSIVDFVRRTHQTLLLGNASTDRRFSQDTYVTENHVQSVLCSPILRHEELKAVLYLENNLASQVFSEQITQILMLLGGQIAISLENSTGYYAMAALNEQLQLSLESGNVGTWCWFMENDFIVWDDRIYEMFDIDRNDSVSAKDGWLKRIHPEDFRKIEEVTMKAISEGTPLNVEYRIIKKNNSVCIIESSGKAIYNDKGNLERMVGVMKDITQRKKLEQERLQALSMAEEKERKRAEEAEKYRLNLENFINQICHEIRNPMSGIFGNVDISQSILATMKPVLDLPGPKREFLLDCWNKLEECASQTEQCVKHQKAVVDDVLDLSKLESSQTNLGQVPFNVNSAVKEVAQMFAAPLSIKEVSVILSLPDSDLWVCGDPRRLKIALTNIISNAVKFTEHGSVKIALEPKEIANTHTSFIVSVEDTGVGMDEEEQTRLFQRFARVAAAQFEGSGLGLYLSKRFVEFMGGTIDVWSKKGTGSKFSVSLNLKTANPSEEQTQTKIQLPNDFPIPQKSVRVLVVEDNVVNQRILHRQLEQCGAVCEVAGNGVEALDKWKKSHYDLIFMDIEMPVMGGFEATGAIRKFEMESGTTQPVMIVGLSAFSSPEFVQKAHEAGMDDYITKPYEKSSIHNAIFKCAEKSRKKRMSDDLVTEKPFKQARSKQ